MHKTKLIHWCDIVPNLVVKLLVVCFFTCLFVPYALLILQKENGLIMIPKTVLKTGL